MTGDMKSMVALQAIVTAATVSLVLFATRLVSEMDLLEED